MVHYSHNNSTNSQSHTRCWQLVVKCLSVCCAADRINEANLNLLLQTTAANLPNLSRSMTLDDVLAIETAATAGMRLKLCSHRHYAMTMT